MLCSRGGVPLYLNYNIIAEVEMGVISKFARQLKAHFTWRNSNSRRFSIINLESQYDLTEIFFHIIFHIIFSFLFLLHLRNLISVRKERMREGGGKSLIPK